MDLPVRRQLAAVGAAPGCSTGGPGPRPTSNMPASQAVPAAARSAPELGGERARPAARRTARGRSRARRSRGRTPREAPRGRCRRRAASSSSAARFSAGSRPEARCTRRTRSCRAPVSHATPRVPAEVPDCDRERERRRTLGGVVLTGGTRRPLPGRRQGLDGGRRADPARARPRRRSPRCREVVVVGDEVLTSRPVTFVREDPPGGGPAAGLLAGLTRFPAAPRLVVVLAVDMPLVTTATVRRLLPRPPGRRRAARRRRRPTPVPLRGLPHARRCSPPRRRWRSSTACRCAGSSRTLELAEVPALAAEARDVDTWDDLRELRSARRLNRTDSESIQGVACCTAVRRSRLWVVNLHDWIDELCDVLDIEVEVDEALILDLARDARAQRGAPGGADLDVPARVRRCRLRRSTRSRSSAWPAWPRRSPCAGTSRPRSSTHEDDDERGRGASSTAASRSDADERAAEGRAAS